MIRGELPQRMATRVSGTSPEMQATAYAPQFLAGPAHSLGKPLCPVALNQVRNDLCIRFRSEAMPICCEGSSKLTVVLDDSIVNDGQSPPAVHVGVGIGVRGASMGRPARMGDPEGSLGGSGSDERLERDDLPDRLPHLEAIPVDRRDPRRVVASILEALETLDQEGKSVTMTNVSDDATH